MHPNNKKKYKIPMKQISTQLLIITSLLVLLLTACNSSSNYTVKGIVSDADGQTIYFENVGPTSVTLLDSVKLNPLGKFEFSRQKTAYPDFYRLRLNNQLINVAVDSTETIVVKADAGTFATSYMVENSSESKAIKEITLAQLDANKEMSKLRKQYEKKEISDSVFQQKVKMLANTYKDVAKKYIFEAPMSSAAYFALFQQIDGLLFFDLYDKNDSKAFGAVATSYNAFYPESERSKQLYNLALQSMKVLRSQRGPKDLPEIKTDEVTYFDMELPDVKGELQKLSSLVKNKVVLVNFTAYQTEWSPSINMLLGDLYTKYHDQGLEIYQISLDSDMHIWKNGAVNLPWTCVRDPQSVYSEKAGLYNVKQLPAIFIIDRKGNLIKRISDVKELESSVKAAM